MAGLMFLLLSSAGLAASCCALAASMFSRWRGRPVLWLSLGAGVILAAGSVIGRAWPLAAASIILVAVIAWLLWRSRGRR